MPWAGGNKCAAVIAEGENGGLQPKCHASEETVMAREATKLEEVTFFA